MPEVESGKTGIALRLNALLAVKSHFDILNAMLFIASLIIHRHKRSNLQLFARVQKVCYVLKL